MTTDCPSGSETSSQTNGRGRLRISLVVSLLKLERSYSMIKRITISLALVIFLGFVPQAFADDGLDDSEVQSSSIPHEQEKLTEEIRTVFEIYLVQDQSGLWRVNDTKSAAAAGIESRDLEMAARNLNSVGMSGPPAGDGNSAEKVGDEGWVRCVLSWSVGSGVIKLLDGTAVGWLKAGKYAKFASWLLRVAPRLALRGGAAGIVAGLAAGVVACSISNG